MTRAKRRLRNLAAVYRRGAVRAGWCCMYCHRPFEIRQQKPKRAFARLMLHRLVRHQMVGFFKPTGQVCRTAHASPNQFVWTALTGPQTWSTTATTNWDPR
jgi:hypothetical protein